MLSINCVKAHSQGNTLESAGHPSVVGTSSYIIIDHEPLTASKNVVICSK